MAALGHKHVRGFYIAVNDPSGMSGIQPIGDLDGEGEDQTVSIGRLPMRCFSVMPSRNSMTMNGCPSCLPIS